MSASTRGGTGDGSAGRGSSIYGPTTGDRVVLADTGLVVEVEHDSQLPGEELLAGFARTARDGMHLKAATVRET